MNHTIFTTLTWKEANYDLKRLCLDTTSDGSATLGVYYPLKLLVKPFLTASDPQRLPIEALQTVPKTRGNE